MGLLSRLLGREGKRKPAERGTILAPGDVMGGIAYDARLVEALKEDHQELVRIYTAIKTAAGEGRFDELPKLLFRLKMALQTHIMLENVRFYVYVQQRCAHDVETSNFISDLRKEMDSIARTVVKFVNAHTANVPTADTVTGFNAELDDIGNMLLWRVQLEESRLYSLYQPNY